MKKLFFLLPLLLLSFGCASNHFNVPTENFADRVKVLGVAPIMVDTGSDIRHPQKEQLIQLITDYNRKFEQQLVRKIKATGSFYTVALIDGDPAANFAGMLFRSEKRDDATIVYNKYFWKNDALRDYIQRNNLDAVMLVVVSGLSKNEKMYSNTMLDSLASEYNYITMTAQLLDANGTILWEYPNFRGRFLAYEPMIALQYPDFTEADANLAEKPDIKFKTLEGIKRRFDTRKKDYLLRETQVTEVYGRQFDEIADYLKYDPEKGKKAVKPATQEKPAATAEPPQATTAISPAPAPTPAATPAPVPAPPQTTTPAAPAAPPAAGTEIIRPAAAEIAPAAGK